MASVEATATAAASVVPFHCIICFETFSVDEHPPVVLPCGHTYVCLSCSKRLKRCMECREPLYWSPPSSNGQAKPPPLMPMPTTRMRALRNPPSPPHASLLPHQRPEQIPLPMPKNLVLLAMMEAAEQQARIATLRNAASIEMDYDSDGDDAQDDITQQACVRLGIGAFAGSCGTYAVREQEGLAVLPFDPRRGVSHAAEEKKSDEPREPFTIIKGQTVQVVYFEGGVAKLARGEGYIMASEQQLVKVGVAQDKSCQLEGLLHMVEVNRREVQAKVDEMERLEQSLVWQIDMERLTEPSQPIVADPPPAHEFILIEESQKCEARPPNSLAPQLRSHLADEALLAPQSPKNSYLIESMDHLGFLGGCGGCSPQRAAKLSPTTIVHCDVEHIPAFTRLRRSTSEDDIRSLAFGCGSSLFGDNESQAGKDVSGLSFDSMEENAPPRIAHAATTQEYRAPHVVRNLQTPTSHLQQNVSLSSPSFDNINFRTGMSGHRGLSSAKAASPKLKMLARSEIRMMSEHRGIGQVRGLARGRGGSTSPSLGGRSSPHTHGSG